MIRTALSEKTVAITKKGPNMVLCQPGCKVST